MKYTTVEAMPGLSFSAVGFGCWGISGGDTWNGTNDAESVRTVRAAVDLGINLFDVAPIYGRGHAEEVLGEALEGRRDDVFISSKCGMIWDERDLVRLDLTAKAITWEVEQSLRRLRTDYLDVYQMHWPDPDTAVEVSMEALDALRTAGKIRHIGVTNFSVERTERCFSVAPVASYQGLYNMLEHDPVQYHGIPLEYRTASEILPMVLHRGMAFFPYSPLFQGLLTDDFKPAGNFDDDDVRSANPKLNGELFSIYFAIAQDLRVFAGEIGRPLSHVAINWLAVQDAVTSVIAGGQTVAHVEQNAAAVDWDLTPDMSQRIEQILAPHRERGLL